MVPTDLSAEQLEQEVPALEMVKGYNVSHLTIAKNIWNDKYGSLNDPSILGFSEKSKGDKDLSETLWKSFVGEVHCLFCTGDARYNELRKRFSQLKGQPAAVIVSIISAGIASTLGIAAGVLAPFVAIILHGIITVGLNSICKASTAGRVAS